MIITTQQAFTINGVPVLALLVKAPMEKLIIMTNGGLLKEMPVKDLMKM